ncbi:MAG: fatty acid hydroxylase family protein [Sphingobacteriales bacterium]|nr:fatty acid hydroxylase family protein [Sphingobacteriales bacterium]
MEYKYAAFAIPAFFLFLGLEYLIAIKTKRASIFKYESSVANLTIGIAERLLNLFISVSFYELFFKIYQEYALLHIPNHWLVWVLLLLSTDLVWYWYHRLGHEVNILWAAHIVHHQSEEFNYTVSARITTIQALIRNVFWCLLPFVGFHPAMVMTTLILHGAYSFFTHTQLIKNLGVMEYVLVTPSIHGVHHASNEKYLNKNYGDLFVFWDKLFGTFAKEEEQPVYGLTHQLKSYSFMWQHFHYYMELAVACRRVNGLRNKLKIIFGNPEILDQNIRPELENKFLPANGLLKSGYRFKSYLNIQLVTVVSLLFLTTYFFENITIIDKLFAASLILITLINCGALLEQRRWIYYLEIIRLLIVIGYISIVFDTFIVLIISALIFGFLVLTEPVQQWFLKTMYDSD